MNVDILKIREKDFHKHIRVCWYNEQLFDFKTFIVYNQYINEN